MVRAAVLLRRALIVPRRSRPRLGASSSAAQTNRSRRHKERLIIGRLLRPFIYERTGSGSMIAGAVGVTAAELRDKLTKMAAHKLAAD